MKKEFLKIWKLPRLYIITKAASLEITWGTGEDKAITMNGVSFGNLILLNLPKVLIYSTYYYILLDFLKMKA